MSGTRKPDTLIGKLREFFNENPHEELTFADIATKFDTTIEHAREVVKRLREKGEVESAYVLRAKHKLRSPGEPIKQRGAGA